VGRAFRNGNAYEMFYGDGVSQMPNMSLRPEQADTFEVAAEHRFNDRLSGLITAYRYQLRNLIEGVVDDAGILQYQNVTRSQTNGVELEASGKPLGEITLNASIALQRAHDTLSNAFLTNSPGTVAKLRGALPLLKNKVRAAGGDAVPESSKNPFVCGSAVLLAGRPHPYHQSYPSGF
jgi:outer membrane receptor protein involved in Fe transport